jgi:hypothetical protein
MPEITAYSFGSMTVGGETITSDLIILPDGTIQKNWWRQEGHNLVPDDVPGLLDAAPDVIVVGTGASAGMSVSDGVLEECRERGIEVRAMPTAEAVKEYNAGLKADARVGACFHLTC